MNELWITAKRQIGCITSRAWWWMIMKPHWWWITPTSHIAGRTQELMYPWPLVEWSRRRDLLGKGYVALAVKSIISHSPHPPAQASPCTFWDVIRGWGNWWQKNMHLLREPFRWPWGSGGTVPSASPSTAGLGYQMWVCTSRSWISPQQTQMLVAVLIKKKSQKKGRKFHGFCFKKRMY